MQMCFQHDITNTSECVQAFTVKAPFWLFRPISCHSSDKEEEEITISWKEMRKKSEKMMKTEIKKNKAGYTALSRS